MNTLIFESENGERTMYIFEKPVKYKDSEGNIVDKNVGFEELTNKHQPWEHSKYICDNGNNDVKIYMPKSMADGVKVSSDDNTV